MNIELIEKAANTVRGLSMDGVQRANSGHPGLPMGAADFATVLWTEFLNHNPKNPNWFNRDRFVLSGGHGSMLLYSLLYLTGYDVSLDDLKDFRQWGSKTPGHPEYGDTPGVETTTGPLGQGLANAVGMALAESSLAARFNKPGYELVDHYTYCMVGDGDLEEGVSHEASSFAGHNKLGKLIVLYDDNDITIDGKTALSFSENVLQRYEAYGWHTQKIDGHDALAVQAAIQAAKENTGQPSIIACKTIIGKGSPNKQGTSHVHGAPLGEEEVELAKKELVLPDQAFFVAEEVQEFFRSAITRGVDAEQIYNNRLVDYRREYPQQAVMFDQLGNENFNNLSIEAFTAGQQLATRSASGAILNQIAAQLPSLIGGSADLTPSNNTLPSNQESYSPANRNGRYIRYGVREFAMGAVMNGLALHGGVIPYGGTFFVFTDYMRSAMRMAALMGIRVVYVLTHDSIGLGEDGPTHQPIEHLLSLRAIPNMSVFRPADANETIVGWRQALQRTDGPTCLVLTRQKLPVYERDTSGVAPATEAAKGGYVFTEDTDYAAILIASGSELEQAVEAKKQLNNKGIGVRIVSMPSTDIFDNQTAAYREAVLPRKVKVRVAVEAGATLGWYKYVGLDGAVIGIDRFGASAPYQTIYKQLGLTTEAVVAEVESLCQRHLTVVN
jgi:transketolase